MIEWLVIGAAVAAVGGLVARGATKKRAHGGWQARLEAVAGRTGARASTGAADPELRGEVDGVTVTLKLVDVAAGPRGRLEAQASLPNPDDTVRLYLGWDVAQPPVGLEHVPEVQPDGPSRLEGHLLLRADTPVVAHRALAAARLDLLDIRREAAARAVELVVRGGYVTLTVHGLAPSEALLERALRVTARLSQVVGEAARGTTLPSGSPAETAAPEGAEPQALDPDARCGLCETGDRAGIGWVMCAACGTPYHEDCWRQATACLAEGCGGTRAVPARA